MAAGAKPFIAREIIFDGRHSEFSNECEPEIFFFFFITHVLFLLVDAVIVIRNVVSLEVKVSEINIPDAAGIKPRPQDWSCNFSNMQIPRCLIYMPSR